MKDYELYIEEEEVPVSNVDILSDPISFIAKGERCVRYYFEIYRGISFDIYSFRWFSRDCRLFVYKPYLYTNEDIFNFSLNGPL